MPTCFHLNQVLTSCNSNIQFFLFEIQIISHCFQTYTSIFSILLVVGEKPRDVDNICT